jgi:flagellar hook protein FlgE
MFTSFSTALSALDAFSTAIDVTGNNLANLDTPGFKASTTYFRDLVTESLGAGLGETQVGFGTGLPMTIRQFSQGAIQTSSGLDDAAIAGEGFFVVNNSQGNQLFTRAGSFQVDSSGTLRTNTGQAVQGWTGISSVTGTVDTNAAIGNIVVPVGGVKQPVATQNMTLSFNLNSNAAADSTSNYSETLNVYDSLGTAHTLTVNFQKTGANTWSYATTIPGNDVSGGTAGTPVAISGASGTLTFDASGHLTSPAAGSPIPIAITGLADGANDMSISWNPYNAAGVGTITQFGQPSAENAKTQDGAPASELTQVGLANGGQLVAQYSDGTQVVVGQVAMANIRNPTSLIAVGNNNYQSSALTAVPAIGVPNTGGRGDIQGGSLESSTVDIAQEFTNLIVLERGYQANSRVVTTADTLSQNTINLIQG